MAGAAPFRASFQVGWGDLDGNGHMGNTAFLDRASDTRLRFFEAHGLTVARFAAERFGPVIARDELAYRRELRLLEPFTVDLEAIGLSADGVRFRLRNTFRTAAEEVAATVTSEGVWFGLDARRPRAPPPEVDAAQRRMPPGEGFVELPARGR